MFPRSLLRICTTFILMMAIGYVAMMVLLPAPTPKERLNDLRASSADILSQQAQALSKR